MFFKKMTAIGAAACAAVMVATEAGAAAFQLTEQSVVTLGRAYSGAGITGDDVSAPFYNPAAMVFLPGTQVQFGVIGVTMNQVLKLDANGEKNDGQNKTEFLPNFYITHQVNDNWWVGLGVTTPFGLSTSYGQYSHGNWNYGNRGTEAELFDIDINPCFAWKPNDFFSFGGGISLQYAKAKLGLDAFNPYPASEKNPYGRSATNPNGYMGHGEETGDSWAWGWNVGILLRPTEKTRFSISYRSAVKHKATGHFKFSNPYFSGKYPSKVTIKTPDTVYASGLWEATNNLTLTGTIRWAKWQNCHEWTLRQSGVPAIPALSALNNIDIRHHYRNTWLFALGADYKINDQWTVRGGVAYEECAVDDQSYRVATIPDGDRLFLSLGASYNFDKHWSVDTALLWVQGLGTSEFYQYDHTDNPKSKRIGKWSTQHSLIYGLQLRYKF